MTAATAGPWPGSTAAGQESAASPAAPRHPSIDITTEGGTVVLSVTDCLDEAAGGALIAAAAAAVDRGPSRIDVDLRALESFTEAGARALVGCRELGPRLPEGLHYRTGRGAGRDALLAAYNDDDPPGHVP